MVYFGPELKVPGDLIGLAHLAVIPEKRTLYARRTHTTKLFKPQRRRNHLFFWSLTALYQHMWQGCQGYHCHMSKAFGSSGIKHWSSLEYY
ncbi:unnamed protein product [Gadus morhua 'NCC']